MGLEVTTSTLRPPFWFSLHKGTATDLRRRMAYSKYHPSSKCKFIKIGNYSVCPSQVSLCSTAQQIFSLSFHLLLKNISLLVCTTLSHLSYKYYTEMPPVPTSTCITFTNDEKHLSTIPGNCPYPA